MLTVPPRPAIERQLVLDSLGDVAVEEDPLSGQEKAAIAWHLVALTPDPGVDLRLEVDSKLKLVVGGRPLKSRPKSSQKGHSPGAGKVGQRKSWSRRAWDQTVPRCNPARACRYSETALRWSWGPSHRRHCVRSPRCWRHCPGASTTLRTDQAAASSVRHEACCFCRAVRQASCSWPPSPATALRVVQSTWAHLMWLRPAPARLELLDPELSAGDLSAVGDPARGSAEPGQQNAQAEHRFPPAWPVFA